MYLQSSIKCVPVIWKCHWELSGEREDSRTVLTVTGSHLRLHKQSLWAQHEFLRSDALFLNGLTPFLRSGFVHDHEPAVPVCHRTGEILTVQEEQDQPDHRGNEAGQRHGPPAPDVTPASLNDHHQREGHDGGNDEECGGKQPVPGRITRTLKLQLHQLLQSHQDEAEGHVGHQRTVAQFILQSRKPLLSTSHTNNTWKSEESWWNSSHTFAEGHWRETNWSWGKFSLPDLYVPIGLEQRWVCRSSPLLWRSLAHGWRKAWLLFKCAVHWRAWVKWREKCLLCYWARQRDCRSQRAVSSESFSTHSHCLGSPLLLGAFLKESLDTQTQPVKSLDTTGWVCFLWP